MLISQWLRRLIESHYTTVNARDVNDSVSLPHRPAAARLEPLEGRQLFAVFTVNSLADGPLASLKGNGTLDLREAIQLATHLNDTVDGYTNLPSAPGTFTGTDPALVNTIRFDPSLAGKTISLSAIGDSTAGPSAFGVTGGAQLTIDGKTGLTKGVTIERGSTAANFRLFYVGSTSSLAVQDVILRGGIARGGNGGGGGNAPGGGGAGLGGAIFNQGNLSLVDVTLTGNTAQGGNGGAYGVSGPGAGGGGMGGNGGDGSGFAGPGGSGGGPNGGGGGQFSPTGGGQGGFGGGGGGGYAASIPYGFGSYANVGIGGNGGFGGGGGGGGSADSIGQEQSSTDGNDAGNGGFGGGGGAPGLDDVGRDPSKGGYGGGWGRSSDSNPGDAGGGAGMGGGVFNESGTVTVTNSTFAYNTAKGGSGTDGTPWNAGSGMGGGIFNRNGTLTVTNSTLSLNIADQGGRGIYQLGDGANAPTVLRNNIIGQSDTKVSDFAADWRGDGGKAFIGGSEGNLIRTMSALGFTYKFLLDSLTGDPSLGALADNGGLTPTMKPQAGSPVIDAGINADVPAGVTTDQRGGARVRNGTVDIGAVETGLTQSISFSQLYDRTYGDGDFQISARATSNLPVSFTAGGNVSVYQDNGVWYAHITGAGSAVITASQDGGLDFDPANSVTQYFQIAKAASQTTTVGGSFTYNGTTQAGGSGTVTGAGGLNAAATSFTYSANADGTGVADRVNAGTYYVTAYYAGDANHLASTGATAAVVINKAAANVNVVGYTGTYDGLAHGATGTATGVDGTSVGTLDLGAAFTTVPGGTASWTFDGGQNYLSEQGSVAIQILAKHITGAFTAADKTYDGTTAATVTSRTLVGVVGNDSVSLVGGKAAFNSKSAGRRTVILYGAGLSGPAAGNYVLDAVATTTALISSKPLAAAATTQAATNAATNSSLPVRINVTRGGIVDGQSVAQLFDGTLFTLAVGGRTYSVRAKAEVVGNAIELGFAMTAELKSILAANTKATNASKAPTVALNLTAKSKDGNYTLAVSAFTKLFNTSK